MLHTSPRLAATDCIRKTSSLPNLAGPSVSAGVCGNLMAYDPCPDDDDCRLPDVGFTRVEYTPLVDDITGSLIIVSNEG